MIRTEKVLAVLLRAADVRNVFPAWPDDVGVAVCLLASGEGKFIVFRREEEDEIPGRLQKILDVASDELCLFPAVAGFPTRKVAFSDMCRLMVMLADEPALLEEAVDYSTNYTFALEEGIDPASFLGRGRGEETPSASSDVPGAEGAGTTGSDDRETTFADTPSDLGDVHDDLGRALVSDEITGGGASGSSQDATMEDKRATWVLEWEEGEWVTVSGTGRCEGELQFVDRDRIYLRDDHRALLLRMPHATASGVPARIRIWPGGLSREVRRVIKHSLGEARLSLEGDFIVVEFVGEKLGSATVDPDHPRQVSTDAVIPDSRLLAKGGARRFSRPVAAAASVLSLLLLVGLGLQISAVAGPQVVAVDGIKYLASSR